MSEVIIDGYRLVLTCQACPEQYDVFYGDEQVGYLRLRHGYFSATCPDYDGDYVAYTACPRGDGIFEEDERPIFLRKAIIAIDQWRVSEQLRRMFYS